VTGWAIFFSKPRDMKPPLSPPSNAVIKDLINEFVSVLRWHDGYADVICPSGHADARLYFDRGFPHLHCHHTKCAQDVATLNHDMREQVADLLREGKKVRIARSPEEKQAKAFRQQLCKITRDTRWLVLPKILEGPETTIERLLAESGLNGAESPAAQQELLLNLFRKDDTIWIGDRAETGSPWYKSQFQQAGEWKKQLPLDRSHQLICPGIFTSGAWSRTGENVLYRNFIVYEADHLSIPDQLKVIAWLRRFFILRAVIFSGNKSLHCWFAMPRFGEGEGYRAMRKIEAKLIGLDADKNMFRPAATTRWCGVERFDDKAEKWTGRMQRLLFVQPHANR
jgi:hypothetical protein